MAALLLPVLGHARLSGAPANLLDADIWVYRNKPGHRDALIDAAPVRLELEAGIAVFPQGASVVARLVSSGEAKPENMRMVQSLPR